MSDDWYLLQSGFFVALSQFANEMSSDRLKYVILEKKLYALDEVSDILLIFGDKEEMTQEVVQKLQGDISKAANYLNYLIEEYNLEKTLPSQRDLNNLADRFGEYLKTEELVEDDRPFDPKQSRSLMQKFIFKSIGYTPGQCNIGPAERLKRLMTGIIFFAIGVAGALVFALVGLNQWYSLILLVPFFLGFYGFFQYFFKFCVVNGLTKKYDMR